MRAIGLLSHMKSSPVRNPLSEDERKAIRSLRANDDIAALPADKGNVTVTLELSTYHEKMVPELCQLPQFCLSNGYCSYEGDFFQQIFGSAVGASISGATANLTIEAIEAKALENVQPRPKSLVRYEDDCFCGLDRMHVKRFLQLLNDVGP
ncbi:uncharacterized protein LOC144175489 [Haemaphysalis longicornis]